MIRGLELMGAEELSAVAALTGIEEGATPEETRKRAVAWMGKSVGCENSSNDIVERLVLEWTARRLDVAFDKSISTDDLERKLRLHIAASASEFLTPGWRLVCALMSAGPANTLPTKLAMLEQAAALAVPSRTALRERRAEWSDLCKRWTGGDPRPELESELEQLKRAGDRGRDCLTVGVIICLVDGRISVDEERLFRHCTEQIGITREQTNDILARVNDLFWRHQNELTPTSARQDNKVRLAEEAARRTMFESGALEGLATEARLDLLAHAVPEEDDQKTGWSRLMGRFSGLGGFFSSKLKDERDATMARIVYHTILKQHEEVAVAEAARSAENRQAVKAAELIPSVNSAPAPVAPPPEPEPEPEPVPAPAQAPAVPAPFSELSQTVAPPPPKRIIKLD